MSATRKQVREQLVSLFTADGSFTGGVMGYAPVDLLGKTRVLLIYIDNTRFDMISKHMNNNFHVYNLDVYVKRESEVNTEDVLDDLREVVRSVVRTNVTDANWNELNLNDVSNAYFAEVSGVPYRVESHSLIVKVSQT